MPHGRNKYLIEKRNEALLKRYYYWTEIKRIRFDDALRILSECEFFISEDRIMAIIRANFDRIGSLQPRGSGGGTRLQKRVALQLSLFPED